MDLDALFEDLDVMLKDSVEEFDTCVSEEDEEVAPVISSSEKGNENKTIVWGWVLVIAMSVVMLFFLLGGR